MMQLATEKASRAHRGAWPLRDAWEAEQFRTALLECHGNQKAAANRLGLRRTTMLMRMKTLEAAGYTVRPAAFPEADS